MEAVQVVPNQVSRRILGYPAYEDAGPQIGCIPAHWEAIKARRVFGEVNDRGHVDEPLLSATQDRGVVARSDLDTRVWNPGDDVSNYKLVCPGDFVISLRSFQGGIEYSHVRGIVSPAYTVLRKRRPICDGFFQYLLKSRPIVAALNAVTTGIRQGKNISFAEFGELILPLPTSSEQRAIAAFLDRETAKLDALIAKKEQLLLCLEEKRQAVVTSAVSGTLDSDREFAPSGIDWIGGMPVGWRVLPIRALARQEAGSFTDGDWVETPHITTDGIRLLQTGNVGVGVFKEQGFRYISETSFNELRCTEVYPNDVLICRLADPVGRACLAPALGKRMITSVDVCILRPSSEHVPQFLVYALSSRAYLDWLGALCRGGTRDRVSRSMLGAIRISVPPRDEQEQIAAYLDRELTSLNALKDSVERAIEKLREYRSALITAAVTGQIDVRDRTVTAEDAA